MCLKASLLLVATMVICTFVSTASTYNQDEYDFIIVGAGSAGAVVASRLSESLFTSVLLLEAGTDFHPEAYILSEIPRLALRLVGSAFDWQYVTKPQTGACLSMNEQRCGLTAGKALGGGSRINNMVYIRGNRQDYDRWANLGNPGWSYDDVLPYFLKSEDNTNANLAKSKYHSTGGLLTVSDNRYRSNFLGPFFKSVVENGLTLGDANGESQMNFMNVQTTKRRGRRMHTGRAFLWPAHNRSNLRVVQGAHAQKILFDENQVAYGVEYIRQGTKHVATASKEVIVSAGAIASPQLLMLSGIGPEDQLKQFNITPVAILSGVGENFMTHVGVDLQFTTNDNITQNSPQLNLSNVGIFSLMQWFFFGTGLLSITVDATGFLNSSPQSTGKWPETQIYFYSDTVSYQDSFSILTHIQRPKSYGTVRLNSSDPNVHPEIDPKYFSHPDDMKLLVSSIKRTLAIGQSDALKQYGVKLEDIIIPACENFEYLNDEYLECMVRGTTAASFHYSGTCKMGPDSDKQAVVDAELRVRKVKRLRVVDTSIMPYIITGNPNAPAIMIGEKASDLIKVAHGI